MFKPIPGNNQYIISLSQEFRDLDGNTVEVEKNEKGLVTLVLYGKEVKVCPGWLSLISHFEIRLKEPSFEKLLNVTFLERNIKFFRPVSGKFPVFKKPVIVIHSGKQYRVIPSYSLYAISKDGDLIEACSKNKVKIADVLRKKGVPLKNYPSAYIYDPDRTGYRYVYIHRLVAEAWVKHPNGDFVRKPVVNHKDADKKNFHARNLEWVSFSENNLHASNSGLKPETISCRVRDFVTGQVYKFPSKSQAAEFMGVTVTTLSVSNEYLRKGKLIKDRYEFKADTDESPWFYSKGMEKIKPGRYLVIVTGKDGTSELFSDIRDFKSRYSIWNVPNALACISVAEKKYPELKFKLIDNYNARPIQALKVATGKVVETKTIVQMEKLLGVSEYLIRSCLRGNPNWMYDGYVFRFKSQDPWTKEVIDMSAKRNKPLKAINLTSGEEVVFKSLRAASRALGITDRYWLKHCVENNVEYMGWKFEPYKEVT